MRAKLSVVIPTLNAAQALPGCLAALMEGVEAGLIRELVITDGGSTDATLSIAEEVGAVLVTGAASRGGQLRRGAEPAAGEWLLFLHADTCLPEGWSGCVAEHMSTGRPAYFRLEFDKRGIWPTMVAGWANLRSRVFGLPYGDQGLLISSREYQSVGGYRDIPLMEDVALARALGRRLTMLPMRARTSALRYQRDGWLRRGLRNLSLLLRYLAGADPERLAGRY
ncbi:TIGR04283 family arsenosugar biosynthesis glycosyltransferase [uncultured Roseovarius sp.]|uniref:TIGR04283 family arsenosugar biosynthesis glycosyltransferase n=1 Tax=uncultured Roseovarius sp. TaxID=293344 RepID=UPI00260B64F5|nr:TIGR04283 family arsenosugar biosynthesis glycosyltransferase [uncultured Roseovarius sp.]